MKIWLDDIRNAPDETWTVVRTVAELTYLLQMPPCPIDVLSLDHDLGLNQPTGYDVAKLLEQWTAEGKKGLPAQILIHSANPVGRKNMQAAIDSIEKMRKKDATHFMDFLNGTE